MSEVLSEVLVERRGRLGHILLNRPRAMNALTHGMVLAMTEALLVWQRDPWVETVLVTGAGERGLCAGGDVVSLRADILAGDGTASARFWADEYRLNALIARYPKPYVAFMDGVVLGGGVGISAHGSHRIVTERSAVGMPETGIGFVPDVGGTWLLSRAPGETGTLAALTGSTFGAGDAIALGLADAFVPSDRLHDLGEELESTDADAAIARFAHVPPASPLMAGRPWIDEAFAADEVADIVARLRRSGHADVAETIAAKSPTALAATLESLRRTRSFAALEEALQQEYRVSLAGLRAPDFAEGVRAQLIDKDRDPHWRPATPVSRAAVRSWFAATPGNSLEL